MKGIKNILVFTNTLEKGGAEMQSVELSKVLSEKYNVKLVVFYGSKLHPELIARLEGTGVNLICLSGKKISVVFEFIKLIKRNKIDCIYSFLATTNFYAGVIGRICGVRYIIGGIRNSYYVGMKLLVQRFLHNNLMTKTIANNYSSIEPLLKSGFKDDKFSVIHNVFPLPLTEDVVVNSSSLSTIVSVARFTAQKDYYSALKSIALLKDKCCDIKFRYLIIGYGELEDEIRKNIDELGLGDVVEIKINPNNIFENLVNSDIYLSTSLFEGTSNSILEAMYAELPVVATNVGDNSYMVTEENGFLTEIKNVDDISDKLSILLQNKEVREKMGCISKKIVLERFSKDMFAKRNFDLLEELMLKK